MDKIIDALPADRFVFIFLWLKWWRMWIFEPERISENKAVVVGLRA
jgi:hypothetical protein